MKTALGVAWLCVACAACSAPERGELTVQRSAIIHGEDDRVEAFAVANDALRELAMSRAVAIAARGTFIERSDGGELDAGSLEQIVDLCPGEPFAEQPTNALCSGLLVDRDLVLTAGHCPWMIACDAMELALGYYYQDDGVLAPLERGDVYNCAEVLASERSDPRAEQRFDYAWIRLDRDVEGPLGPPIAVRDPSQPLAGGEPLAMFGFPDGTPLKVDPGAVVDDARPATLDYFTATTDSFYGNSGSPIVDAAGVLVGIQNRGAADFIATEAGCNALARAQPGAASEEQATYAFRALDGLCEQAPSRWPCPGADVVHASTACTVTRVRGTCDGRWAALCVLALCLALARRRS